MDIIIHIGQVRPRKGEFEVYSGNGVRCCSVLFLYVQSSIAMLVAIVIEWQCREETCAQVVHSRHRYNTTREVHTYHTIKPTDSDSGADLTPVG